MKLHIGNLPRRIAESQLSEMIASVVTPLSVVIARDVAGRSKGFASVDVGSAEDAETLISAMNGAQLEGHTIRVVEIKSAAARAPRGGRGSLASTSAGDAVMAERRPKVAVFDATVREAASRLLSTTLVPAEISYVRRELGASATQEDLDAKILAVRRLSWSEVVEAEVADRRTLRRRN